MNINQLMQQAQKMQKEMTKAQEEVGNMIFIGKQDLVTVEVNGNKKVAKVTFSENIEIEDLEALQDMILLATNDAIKQAENEMEKRLGKYSKAMPGLF